MEQFSQCSFPSQEKECPPPQLISAKSLPVPESVSSTVGSSSPLPRPDSREFFQHIKRTPVSPEAGQEIIRLFDFETVKEQSPAVLSQLEKLMGYEGYPWLNMLIGNSFSVTKPTRYFGDTSGVWGSFSLSSFFTGCIC